MLDFESLISLVGDRYGEIDVACPECGPSRRTPSNRERKVLRVWRDQPDFVTFHCVRCGLKGHARRHGAHADIDLVEVARLKAEAAARDADYVRQQQRKARGMWSMAVPIVGTPAEAYLRSRGICCDLPATLRFLPPSKPEHHPAMIAAFGLAEETEPGRLSITGDVVSVHLTLLRPDGSGKANVDPNKIIVGPSMAMPIVLAPPNDLLGLAITEGIEDALSVHQASGLGAWAAGCASRMPALADAIPFYMDCVSILVDDNDAGRKGSYSLDRRLAANGLDAELLEMNPTKPEHSERRIAA
jgi:hypothetical protein